MYLSYPESRVKKTDRPARVLSKKGSDMAVACSVGNAPHSDSVHTFSYCYLLFVMTGNECCLSSILSMSMYFFLYSFCG